MLNFGKVMELDMWNVLVGKTGAESTIQAIAVPRLLFLRHPQPTHRRNPAKAILTIGAGKYDDCHRPGTRTTRLGRVLQSVNLTKRCGETPGELIRIHPHLYR